MKPALGWTQFSRDALRKAEAAVLSQEQGVRDEIGFLLLHQAYADRFFPGTSVLQTRLRYILFIPWMYESIARKAHTDSVDQLLAEEEMKLIGRLKMNYQNSLGSDDGVGIIGGRSHDQGRLTSQSSSMIYWGSLGRWGVLKAAPGGALPSRAIVHKVLRYRQHISKVPLDDDGQPVLEEQPLFANLPEPPPGWDKVSVPLSFQFPDDKRDEVGFVRRHLASCCRRDGGQSLLAVLSEVGFHPKKVGHLWDRRVWKLAPSEDRKALLRAGQVASLAAIGRAVYAALVEHVRDFEDELSTANIHRDNLQEILNEHRDGALQLDIPSILEDAPQIDKNILQILQQTRRWIESSQPVTELWDDYAFAELKRKGGRARLPRSLGGRNRRAEWLPENHPKAYPLSYRWSNVVRLLRDLKGDA